MTLIKCWGQQTDLTHNYMLQIKPIQYGPVNEKLITRMFYKELYGLPTTRHLQIDDSFQ